MSADTELIKDRLDIAEIVGEYVPLKRAGHHYKGLCPFHQEKTPSFIVSPEKGIWHCFGCNKNGDIFSFVQEIEALDFPAALKLLAERAGVTLAQQAPAHHDPRARQFELHALAARFFHELLINQKVGAKAKQYLAERGVNSESLELFTIGYAPQQWNSLQKFLETKGFSDREMIDSGLVGKSDRGTLYDRFRGRIMFPIHDIQGRVVAFGGRITPWHATGEEGKYINSPETAIYSKRRVVYNLNRAKRSLHQQPCVVVEGYMDVVLLVQGGVTNVVASSGTAFTAEHIATLQRYTGTLHFAFDGDAAGIKAAEAATAEAATAGLRVATILFPAGQDPADVAHQHPEKLAEYLAHPTSMVSVLVRHLQATEAGADRENILDRLLPLVQHTTNLVQQGEMIQELADTLHVPESVVVERLAAVAPRRATFAPAAPEDGALATSSMLLPDQLLLGLLMLEPAVRQALWGQLHQGFFTTPDTQRLWQALSAQQAATGFLVVPADELIAALPEELVPLAEAVRQVTADYVTRLSRPPLAEAGALLRSLKLQQASHKLKALRDRLAGLSGDERVTALREFQTALAELSSARR